MRRALESLGADIAVAAFVALVNLGQLHDHGLPALGLSLVASAALVARRRHHWAVFGLTAAITPVVPLGAHLPLNGPHGLYLATAVSWYGVLRRWSGGRPGR
ncbi:hypothetical protein [Bailinhaonella thermotolerans]|uniref:Uncharacterized protein n=1 Tax=Bailinhaonella thermotolerans TaxID=1070861 RepID=A0A3A4APX3_9ACTN|nr:hypothetical protein [Bailinhaonella thermotolerans]RJL30475.1 hypothetical protein D5H75_23205 [Bailinhaonella thermotolerans]